MEYFVYLFYFLGGGGGGPEMPPCLTPDRELLMSRDFEKILSAISTSQKY